MSVRTRRHRPRRVRRSRSSLQALPQAARLYVGNNRHSLGATRHDMDQIKRRRTFAIISHPDAGKTTLTEKLLLYGGAVSLAGSVTARKNQRATASDWMEIERQRGISVSSTVLQFEYRGHCINLLDTPGHRDFSEDTYRVLTAVDAAMMVVDAGKGIESQTRKLFEVCRSRGAPIFAFMNKLDRPSRDPLWLVDEIERVLGMRTCAVNWPMGSGTDFRGVVDRRTKQAHLFDRAQGGAQRARVAVHDFGDEHVRRLLGPEDHARLDDELALLEATGGALDAAAVRKGQLAPVFFGSAATSFGVEMLLDAFIDLAPAPAGRSAGGRRVEPDDPAFSGFIFKIQANLDPRHRDRLAFVRVCSGRFQRDMQVFNTRTGERLRLSSTHRLFGRDRESVSEAHPGDVVGVVGHGGLRIGDTLAEDPSLAFDPIPSFAPECFAWLRCASAAQSKRFHKGLDQLLQEGVVQAFHLDGVAQRIPLLGAVGPLQFDVVEARLRSEYGIEPSVERAAWTALRWVQSGRIDPEASVTGAQPGVDSQGRRVVLFSNEWTARYYAEKQQHLSLVSVPNDASPPEVCVL